MSEARYYIDDEFDFRGVILDLLNGWRWILAAGAIAAVIAFVVASFLPKEYRTSATIVLTKPDVIFRFDPRIESDLEVPSGEGIPNLALSSGVLSELRDQVDLQDDGDTGLSYETIRENLEAAVSGTILTLTAESTSPEGAASLANTWSSLMVARLNEIYAPSSSSAETFQDQTREALRSWHAAQDAYVGFQSENRERILLQRLTRAEQALSNALGAQRQVELSLTNIAATRAQLDLLDPGQPTDLRMDLSSLVIAMQTNLGALPGGTSVTLGSEDEILSLGAAGQAPDSPIDLLLQLSESDLIPETVAELLAFLNRTEQAHGATTSALEQDIIRFETDILMLQGQLSQVREQRARLEEERDLAREAYQTLARKSQENRITSGDQESVARLASEAAVPHNAVSPRRLLLTVTAGAFGVLLGALGVVMQSWWATPEPAQAGAGTAANS